MPIRCLATASLLLLAATLPAAEDPLDAFPAETGVLLRIGSPTNLTTKARAFLNNAAPQFAILAEQIGPGLGTLIGNPTLNGMDANSELYAAGLPRQEGTPTVVIAVRATDPDALRQAIGPGYTAVAFEEWVLYSQDAEAMSSLPATGGKSFGGSLSESLDPLFREGEFSVFLNVPVLREVYRPQLQQWQDHLGERLKSVGEPSPEFDDELNALLTAVVESIDAAAFQLAIDGDAIRSRAHATVRPGTPLAGFLAKQNASKLPLLEKLPAGHSTYFASAGNWREFSRVTARLIGSREPDDEVAQRLVTLLSQLSEVGPSSSVGTISLDDTGQPRMISLLEVENPDESRTLFHQLYQTTAKLDDAEVRRDITVEPGAETIDGVAFDVITMKPVAAPAGEPRDEAGTLRNETQVVRLGVVDGILLQTIGEGVAQQAVDAIRRPTAEDKAFHETLEQSRAELLDTVNLLLLVDVPQQLSAVLQLAIERGTLPLPVDPQRFETLEFEPSFAGTALVVRETGVDLRGHLPAEQVAGLVKLFQFLQRADPR